MGLVAAGAPDNLRTDTPWGQLVESDVFDICKRIKDVDDCLVIYVMPEASRNRFSIVELCRDGVERLVFRCDELDGRIIEKLERLIRIPFSERFAALEKLEAKDEEERKAKEFEQMYEHIGAPMLRDLERCGFIQRPRSYAKRGIRFAA